MLFCCLLIYFKIIFFQKILSRTPSECLTVWYQINPNILSRLIWIQTVCKSYQQTTPVGLRVISCQFLSWSEPKAIRSRSTKPNQNFIMSQSREASWFESHLVANSEDRFYHNEAHIQANLAKFCQLICVILESVTLIQGLTSLPIGSHRSR